jgi:prepilin-type N-terminal cleavage/methylation domain-containing protein
VFIVNRMIEDKKYKRQAGFTLIEIAVVLMIAGSLMGAILKGQQLIDMAKEKQLESDFKNIPMMIYGYQDKYKAIPGDDKNAVNRFPGITDSVRNGDGEGLIAGKWFDFNPTTDSTLIWQHLRLAGLMNGETNLFSSDYMPQNALGKAIDLHSGSDYGSPPILDLQGHALQGTYTICSRGIPGELAISLDIRLDDGNPGMGQMLVTPDVEPYTAGAVPATVGTNASTDIAFNKLYIVCLAV